MDNLIVDKENIEDCIDCLTKQDKGIRKYRYDSSLTFYTKAIFIFFIFLWVLIILVNKLVSNEAAFVLFIPFVIFLLGLMNSEVICDEMLEDDIFTTTFISIGIIIAIPFLTFINKDKDLTDVTIKIVKIMFLSIILILLTYFHIWVPLRYRHIVKVIRSCIETLAVTLCIFAFTLYYSST